MNTEVYKSQILTEMYRYREGGGGRHVGGVGGRKKKGDLTNTISSLKKTYILIRKKYSHCTI